MPTKKKAKVEEAPVVEDEVVPTVEEEPAPPPEEEPTTEPLLDKIPTTGGEIKDGALKLGSRAKEIGATPIMKEIGAGVGRMFKMVNGWFDDMEGKKK